MARAALCRAVFAMDRLLCLERGACDGRDRAGLTDAVAAALRHLCARSDVPRRTHHAADRAVRRRRRPDGRDLYADAEPAGAAAGGLDLCASVMPAAIPTPSTYI